MFPRELSLIKIVEFLTCNCYVFLAFLSTLHLLSVSLDIFFFLFHVLQKITWLGPLRFSSTKQDKGGGTVELAEGLGSLSSSNVTFVGKLEFEESLWKSKSFSHDNFLRSAAVVWEILKGGKLPGLLALDRVCICFSIFLLCL